MGFDEHSIASAWDRFSRHTGWDHVWASAELKDPLSPLTSAKGSISAFDATIRQCIWRSIRSSDPIRPACLPAGLRHRRAHSAQRRAEADWSRLRLVGGSGDRYLRPQDDPNFNKPAGFDCTVTIGNSAEERGYLLIDPAQDAKSLTLFLQDWITAYSGAPGQRQGYDLTLGPQDRTFALTRIRSKACEAFR